MKAQKALVLFTVLFESGRVWRDREQEKGSFMER